MNRWVLASSNPGKLKEFQHALAPVLAARGVALVNQSELGIPSAEEPHETFEENALAKALHASALSGLPALADDSGICVDVLNGAPGVRSARIAASDPEFAGIPADEANLRWLLREMQRARDAQYPNAEPPELFWNCAFHAVIAFVRSADDSAPVIAKGTWNARVITTPRGEGGFGYDPIFFDRDLKMTAAEMTVAQKQAVSHRGKALRKLIEAIL